MGIVQWPDDVVRQKIVICVICEKAVPVRQVAAGLRGSDGRQRFACNGHFLNGAQFIVDWADFIAGQQRQYLYSGKHPDKLQGTDVEDAWSLR